MYLFLLRFLKCFEKTTYFCTSTANPNGFKALNTLVTFEASFNCPGSSYMSSTDLNPETDTINFWRSVSATVTHGKNPSVLELIL